MSGGMEMPVVTTATAGALRMLRDVATRDPLATELVTYKLLDALARDAKGTAIVVSALITILQEAAK